MEKIVKNDEGRVIEKVVEKEEWHKLILGWSKAVTATLVALFALFATIVVIWFIVNCSIRNECEVKKVTIPFFGGSVEFNETGQDEGIIYLGSEKESAQ